MSSADPDTLFRAQENQRNSYYKPYPNRNVVFRAINLIETGFYYEDETNLKVCDGDQDVSESRQYNNHHSQLWTTT